MKSCVDISRFVPDSSPSSPCLLLREQRQAYFTIIFMSEYHCLRHHCSPMLCLGRAYR